MKQMRLVSVVSILILIFTIIGLSGCGGNNQNLQKKVEKQKNIEKYVVKEKRCKNRSRYSKWKYVIRGEVLDVNDIFEYRGREFARTNKGDIRLSCLSKAHKLKVVTDPIDTTIKIMNIGPRYQDNIALATGKYHIKVIKKGYVTYSKWIDLKEDLTHNVKLISIKENQAKLAKQNKAKLKKLSAQFKINGDIIWNRSQKILNTKIKKWNNLKILQETFDLTSQDIKKLTQLDLPQKPKQKKLEKIKKLKKGEFETSNDFNIRVQKHKAQIEAKNQKIKKDNQRLIEQWNKEVALTKQKNQKLKKEIEKQKNDLYLSNLEQVINHVYGKPIIKSANYNADKKLFDIEIESEKSNFKKKLQVKIDLKDAKKFKELITDSKFIPHLLFEVKDNKLSFKNVLEFTDIEKFFTNIEKVKKWIKIRNIDLNPLEVDIATYADTIYGNGTLKEAAFLGKKIWQDQKINEKRDYMVYKEAKRYCENLDLLGIKEWVLPSVADIKLLDDDRKKLKHVANRRGMFSFAFTNDTSCVRKRWGKVEKGNCVYVADVGTSNKKPYITDYTPTSKGVVRCVLDPNIFNKHRKKEALEQENLKTFDGYLKAFTLNGKESNIDQAIALAKSNQEKSLVENSLKMFLVDGNVLKPLATKKLIYMYRKKGDFESYIKAYQLSSKISDLKFAQTKANTLDQKTDIEALALKLLPSYDSLFETSFTIDQTRYNTSASSGGLFSQSTQYGKMNIDGGFNIKMGNNLPLDLKFGEYNVSVELELIVPINKQVRSKWVGNSDTKDKYVSKKRLNFIFKPNYNKQSTSYQFKNRTIAYFDRGSAGGFTAKWPSDEAYIKINKINMNLLKASNKNSTQKIDINLDRVNNYKKKVNYDKKYIYGSYQKGVDYINEISHNNIARYKTSSSGYSSSSYSSSGGSSSSSSSSSQSSSESSRCKYITNNTQRKLCRAFTKREDSYCQDISDSNYRNYCRGVLNNSDSYCRNIADQNLRALCRAKVKGSKAYCKEIHGDSNMKSFCKGNCYSIGDSNMKELCRALQ